MLLVGDQRCRPLHDGEYRKATRNIALLAPAQDLKSGTVTSVTVPPLSCE
jgi:hypothetical protein